MRLANRAERGRHRDDRHNPTSITRQIDQGVDAQAQQDESTLSAVAVGRQVLDDASGDAVVITSNTNLATMPGNVFLPAVASGLPRESVVNVTAVITMNKVDLTGHAGRTPLSLLQEIDRGLRTSLDL